MQATGTEERMKPVAELICKGVNVDSCVCAEEGHTAFGVIQKHTHPPRTMLYSHQAGRRRVCYVLASSFQAQSPEAVSRAEGELALPVYGLSGNSQFPLNFFPYFHFPVAPPTVKALLGQNICYAVEAFGVVRYLLELISEPDQFSVI